MSEAYEYGEDEFDEEEYEYDGKDDMRRAIMEAEINEVWLEEPADDEDEIPPVNPMFGMLSAMGGIGFPGIPPVQKGDERIEDEDSGR